MGCHCREDGKETLKERVEGIRALADIRGVDTEAAERDVLQGFYDGNPLARAIAYYEDTYAKRIQFILDKYTPWRTRIFGPTLDEAFDAEVKSVLESMAEVGVEHINPHFYATNIQKEEAREGSNLGVLLGICFAGITACIYAIPLFFSSSQEQFQEGLNHMGAYLLILDAVLVLPYVMATLTRVIGPSNYLTKNLRNAAAATDHWLRGYHVENFPNP